MGSVDDNCGERREEDGAEDGEESGVKRGVAGAYGDDEFFGASLEDVGDRGWVWSDDWGGDIGGNRKK